MPALHRQVGYELRKVAFVAIALILACGIEAQIAADPDLGEIEGFALADDLIVANWLRGAGLWCVDPDAPSSRGAAYREISKPESVDRSGC